MSARSRWPTRRAPTSRKLPIAKELIVHDAADIQRIYLFLGDTMINDKPIKALVSPAVAGSVWKQNNEMADKANEPGKFTAFCAYEWTSTPDNRNMHRNVFFKDCAKVPEAPFSSLESTDPTDLWKWMDEQRQAGNELLAISHNANLSDGHMFPIDVDQKGRPIDAAWAASRDRNELLTEIKQIKGQSETHPSALAQRRVRQLRVAELPARQPGRPHSAPFPAASCVRPSRTA